MIRTGTEVKWKWGSGTATGKVTEIFKETVSRTIKGNKVTRNGSDEDRAFLIEQEDGDKVLKLESEVERA